jgi:hypothetical protein
MYKKYNVGVGLVRVVLVALFRLGHPADIKGAYGLLGFNTNHPLLTLPLSLVFLFSLVTFFAGKK